MAISRPRISGATTDCPSRGLVTVEISHEEVQLVLLALDEIAHDDSSAFQRDLVRRRLSRHVRHGALASFTSRWENISVATFERSISSARSSSNH